MCIDSTLDISGESHNGRGMELPDLKRITIDPLVMGGKPCVRGMRVTVGMITGLVASGSTFAEILRLYPYLDEADLRAALAYAAWRAEEREASIAVS